MNNNQGRRRTRRVRQQRKQKNTQISRILLTICMMALVAVVSIGGTLAWLTDKTETITNTFTTAGIDIKLTETFNADSDDADTENDHWEAQLIPGKEYTKDPTVEVIRTDTEGKPVTNVDVYLFVKFEANSSATYLTYTSNLTKANGWTVGDGTDIPADVWYRTVKATDTETSFKLLADDKVTVKPELVKADDTTGATPKMPSSSFEMKYTAYATQTEGLTAAEAWDKIGN